MNYAEQIIGTSYIVTVIDVSSLFGIQIMGVSNLYRLILSISSLTQSISMGISKIDLEEV